MSLAEIISKQEMQRLSKVYFEKVHPLYSFVNRMTFIQQVEQTWNESGSTSHDDVLCGVAALGSLFSGPNACDREADIVRCAKNSLEMTSTLRLPSLDHVTAWILRTLYLRMAVGPHAGWMASCITMHMVEATGAHQETPNASVMLSEMAAPNGEKYENSKRATKLYWVARFLNTWISNEYGRARVDLQTVSSSTPLPQDNNDLTPSLVSIYLLSERFNSTTESKSVSELAIILEDLDRLPLINDHDVLTLHKANNAFAIYRRLRTISSHIPRQTLSLIIALGIVGLQGALRMARVQQPWWHVANIPFQFVCVLLAMDTRESLSRVGEAMSVLRAVAQHFDTWKMRKAVDTAELLIQMYRKNKEKNASVLGEGLETRLPDALADPASIEGESLAQPEEPHLRDFEIGVAKPGLDLDLDLDNFDWDLFLSSNPEFLMS